ncbi:lysophospholipase L1-like esterase [Gordonia phage Rabbitrun]|uniref:Minor tail protein n=1 Tax=Gordonia phage Rabbitrun TaxID=2762280 RepID=A0A7G8LIJ6_9CAUD|nr:lysophospholipase L1-like esterase [Gordonia phage Rabbitrun]QNJ57068.1 minor tail protein [Gordonia phage Rabbitrun]
MARYNPNAWVNGRQGGTPITAEKLNRLEEAVADASFNPKPIVISTRSKTGNLRQATSSAASLSAGTTTAHSTRLRHFATANAHSIQIVYGNIAMGEPGPNPITVKSAFEYAAGAVVPAFFNGARTATDQPGGILVTDAIPAEVAPGTFFRTRQMVSVSTVGEKWPIGALINTSVGDGGAATDTVDGGNMPDNNGAGVFCPTAVIGVPYEPTAALYILGDSIMQGVGDTGGEPATDAGWVCRALNSQYGYINASRAGETAEQFAPGNARRLGRLQLAQYCTHALVGHGVNDIKADVTLAQLQARLLSMWNTLDRMGLKVYQSTITPVTTGTFSTPEGQVKQSAAREAVRLGINDWIRSTPGPLSGYVEAADSVETARGSGTWKNDLTADGTHPNAAGAAAMAAGWNPSVTLAL